MKHLLNLVFLVFALSSQAQDIHLALSGNYGIVAYNQGNSDLITPFGGNLTFELEILQKRASIGVDADWIFFKPVAAVALPFSNPGIPQPYSIKNHQLNFRPTFRYYFKNAYEGLYVGVFGAYSYQTITTSGYPTGSGYSEVARDPQDRVWSGGGLTYGYRFKLVDKLLASVYGSHQFGWEFDKTQKQPTQQIHQIGLGLGWVF